MLGVVPSSETSPSILAGLPAGEEAPQGVGAFSFSHVSPSSVGPVWIPLSFFPFVRLHGDSSYPFSRFSVRIVPHVDEFLKFLKEEVNSISSYSAILSSLT